ncbi:MAG: SpoIID/LytB domain-containing protein [Eubacteriales bacterium]|nr:SpoIID/LytB domain-containing protein [Eubacteriales bacterium]
MKETVEHILMAILVILILPCIIIFLLNGKMKGIYQAIKNDTQYISVKTGSGILEMELEEYVIGVTAAQIPLGYDVEAVKAQMVLARTNICRQILEKGEVKRETFLTMEELERAGAAEKFLRAESSTRGQILVWKDKPIMASFHSVSSGNTRDGNEVLDSTDYPYLKSKACPSDQNAPDYKSVIQIDGGWSDMEITKRDSAGYVQQIQLKDEYMSGEEFRNLLGLPSSDFDMEVRTDGVFLTIYGVGHGLGMSQYTAQQMALSGKKYREILGYFYTDVKLSAY